MAYTDLTSLLKAIANSIRSKTSTTAAINAQDFPSKIDSIKVGITPSGTKSITSNGTYDVTNYASANVNVPVPSITVKSAFNQQSYTQGFYATLDLGGNKTCYSAQGYSGDSEGTKKYVTPQYSTNNSTWTNYRGGTVTARYWRAQMSGGEHIGNFAAVLCAYSG